MIPLCDLVRQYHSLKDEIDAAMQTVAAGGHYILGPNVKALEKEIATYCGCPYAVGVANGTDAIHLALRALGIGPGDEVITTPFSFIATTEAIGIVGAKPVFVDIDPCTFNIDPANIEAAITTRTKAILPVHLYGQPCDMARILIIAKKHGLRIVEDCAQSIGATYQGQPVGSFGDAGCLSFFPSKNLGCIGDGGMVVSNSPELAERVDALRRHGGRVKYYHEELGINSRLDELQAAVLRIKLAHLPHWTHLRRELAYAYNRMLEGIAAVIRPSELIANEGEAAYAIPALSPSPLVSNGPCMRHDGGQCGGSSLTTLPPGSEMVRAVYHQYTILIDHRDTVSRHLLSSGIANAVYYPVPLHLQNVHASLGYQQGSFPHAEHAARNCLSLPIFPELSHQELSRVAEVLAQVAREQSVVGDKAA